jgi:hypothetical protein
MIKYDKRNYRKHNEKNKALIKKSLEECGFGRSILLDKDDEIVAGNGVYEQAQKLGLKTKIIETDGSELIVLKRKDLRTKDEKRKKLAILDNTTSDTSETDYEKVEKDFTKEELNRYGLDLEQIQAEVSKTAEAINEKGFTDEERQSLPIELQSGDIEPDELKRIESDFETEYERIIITFPFDRQCDLERLLGIPIQKIFYEFKDILAKRNA